jgi:hypothetical protein
MGRRGFCARLVAVLAALLVVPRRLLGVLPASDNFNRGSLGPKWTNVYGTWGISSQQADISGTAECCMYWNDDTFADDQYSQCSIEGSNTNHLRGPAVRASGSGYFGFYGDGGGGALFYSNGDGSDYNEIASSGTAIALSSVLYLSIEGTPGGTSTLKTKDDGSQYLSDQTSSVSYDGEAGVTAYQDGSVLDNWQGDDIGGGAPAPPMLTLLGVGS